MTSASAGGIWTGVDSASGLQIQGIVDEWGEAAFIRKDGVLLLGTVTTSGNNISGSGLELPPTSGTLADGSTQGGMSISGTISARQSAQVSYTSTTANGTNVDGTINLTFNSVYDQSSSLSVIAGSYTDLATNTPVIIDANGNLSATNPATGCTVTGAVSIIEPQFNAYAIDATYSGCQGQSAFLNGIQFTGIGTMDTEASPEQLLGEVSGSSGGTTVGIVYELNRS